VQEEEWTEQARTPERYHQPKGPLIRVMEGFGAASAMIWTFGGPACVSPK
jgi:hypothetical protein